MWIYSMRDVLSLLQQDGYFHEGIPMRGEHRCSCPKCGGKKIDKCFKIDLDTESYGCFKCGWVGKYSQNLYADLNGIDRASASKEIMGRLGIDPTAAYPKRERKITPMNDSIETEAEVASVDVRNKVYRTTLRCLNLSDKHKNDLLNRGLTEREISELGYKTFPGEASGKEAAVKTVWKITDQLKEKKFNPEGCAGFYKTKNKNLWFCKIPKNDVIMVKYMSFDNKLTGFQQRRNNEDLREGDEKYLWWSSKKENHGAKPAGMIHYAVDFEKTEEGYKPKLFTGASGEKYMCITEGAMKGDIAHMISGKPFICLPGVGIYKDLIADLPRLKELGVTTFMICYDTDQLMNINVLRHQQKLAELLVEAGFKVKNGTVWDLKYKTVQGDVKKFSLEDDFVFTPKTLKEAVEDEKLESILNELSASGRSNLFLAISDRFDKESKELYSKLLLAAKKGGFKSCKYVQYKITYKGIDDFYAGTQRNVEYI